MIRRVVGLWACAATCVALAALPSRPAAAQAVLGIGDDALVLPRGALRVRLVGQWSSFNERYGKNTPGRPNGALEPLAVDFNLDTIGVVQFPSLIPLQAGLRQLSGQADLTVSLGKTVVTLDDRIAAYPIVVEVGATQRLSFGLTVPIVKTRSNVFFNANPNGNEGNVAFNPALSSAAALAADTAFALQLVRAGTALAAYCAGAGAATPQCLGGGSTVAANAIAFGQGLAQVYGGSPFVPVAGSDVQQSIDTRGAYFRTTLNNMSLLVPGMPTVTATGVIGAQARLTAQDAQTILTNPAFGVSAAPLATVDRYHVGDIELGAKYALFDSFKQNTTARLHPTGVNTRAAVGMTLRFPTGQLDSPDNFIDLGTGSHQWSLGLRGYGDVLLGEHFWTSLVARYNFQFKDEITKRITEAPERQLAALYRRSEVTRQLGNLFELEATPRWVVNDFFSVSAQYLFRSKPKDKYTGTVYTVAPGDSTGGTTIVVNPSTLDLETDLTEHRFGGGVSFSTIAAFNQGRAKIPFEATYFHQQTTKGRGGNVPKVFTDQIQFRIYARIFGN